MGLIHNALRRGGFSAALSRALGDSKGEGGLERYGETLQAVLDLWRQPEWSFLRREWLWAERFTVTAGGAGEESILAILNPTASNLLVTIDAAVNFTAAMRLFAMYMTSAQVTGTLTQGNPPQNRDLRFQRDPTIAGSNPPVEVWSGADPTFPFNTIVDQAVAAGGLFQICVPTILRPGTAFALQGETAATAIEGVIAGKVRAALPGELP